MTITNKKSGDAGERLDALDQMSKKLPLHVVDDYVTSTKITPSGSLALDLAIGIGGYPSGCIIDTFGAESAGKSLLSIMAMAQAQKAGGVAIVWDVERSYSKNTKWLQVNGVDPTKLRYIKLRPEQGCEIGMDAVEEIAASKLVDLIVVDSIPAMVPQASLDRSMAEADMVSSRANVLSRHLARLVSICDQSKTSVMVINQIRSNMNAGKYGDPERETSIFALKHYSSLRLKVIKLAGKENIRIVDGMPIGHRVRVKVVKNKLAPPYRIAEFDLLYHSGVNRCAEMADILLGANAAEQSGAWVKWSGEKYNGRDAFVAALSNEKLFSKAMKEVLVLNEKINSFGIVQASVPKPNGEDAISIDDSDE